MTKRLADCTPEEAEKLRKAAKAYRLKTLERHKATGAARHKYRYANDPDYRARKDRQANEARMRRLYGITTRDRDEMIAAQNNRCAICETETPGGRGWHVDHCHSSGVVRAILCTACNVFVGRIEKNPELHKKVLGYIERHKNGQH